MIDRLTSEGRVTIPKAIRDRLYLRKGHRVEFHIDADGRLVLAPCSLDVGSLKGLIRSGNRPVTVEQMNEVIAKGCTLLA